MIMPMSGISDRDRSVHQHDDRDHHHHRDDRHRFETRIDKVSIMEGLVQPDKLRARILLWA
jgi:hypothetical protein